MHNGLAWKFAGDVFKSYLIYNCMICQLKKSYMAKKAPVLLVSGPSLLPYESCQAV